MNGVVSFENKHGDFFFSFWITLVAFVMVLFPFPSGSRRDELWAREKEGGQMANLPNCCI